MVSTRSVSRSGTPAASVPMSPKKSAQSGIGGRKTYTHAPSSVVLGWLFISLPLVAWDTGYVLGRPHTMPGGWAHIPLWQPYDLYGRIDRVYGFKAWEAKNGFTGGQSFMNLVEMTLYMAYLSLWYLYATPDQRLRHVSSGTGNGRRVLRGRMAAAAVLICFSAAVMTLSKTVLYWMCEYFSFFDNIGHNDLKNLVFLWIIPNGAWIILPGYIVYILGSEIVVAMAHESTM